ncbi:putative bifunctional diguanylate cyclase/phosphodiesterase [Ferrimonas marina]|uniref:PAS domain S-box-containing protein/diguanylate cyclase (GGDEF) domain-containing protein n=1 Tax=Ferrimonas marina TaxID=299255 RepID=A0A1M5XPC8_9GAMM|nr:EAL domain-containing protein [Ferrimonas marina]SHI01697.1 PAS domain S-box-containing protein/diguanylate cyclase (GGDEF) domain-containing protein [Ferrimonas marina]
MALGNPKPWPSSLPLVVLIPAVLLCALGTLIALDFFQGRDMMRAHLKQAQEHLLMQRARQMEQLLVAAGPSRIGDVAEQSLLQWAQEEELLAAAIVDRDQRIYFGSRLVWRGGQASRLLEGYENERARKALLSGLPKVLSDPQRGSLHLYYPLAQLKPHMQPRLIYMEQDLTALNQISQDLFVQRLFNLWSFGLVLLLLLWAIGHRCLAQPLQQIQQQSRRLGESTLDMLPQSRIKEFDQLILTLGQANSRLRQGYAQLVESEQRWLYAVEGIKAGVWDWYLDSQRVYFSHHWKAMLGYRDDELMASYAAWEQRLHPDDRERVVRQLEEYVAAKSGLFENLYRLRHREGHYVWVQDRALIVDWDANGDPCRIVGSHLDVSDEVGRRSHERRDNNNASRMAVVSQLETLLTQLETPGYALLFYLDMDDFKLINDAHGYEAGDRLLAQVQTRLEKLWPDATLLRRMQGDEFVVLLTGLDPQRQALVSQAQEAAESILQAVSQGWLLEGEALHLGTSVGMTLFQPGPQLRGAELLTQAELAVYQCKAQGRGGYVLYKSDLQQKVRQQLWLRDALSQGLNQGEISLYYQPIMDASGNIHAAEALLRWHNPQRGEIVPNQFLPVAERYGLCHELAELQLAQACRDMAVMRRYGLSEMMINVSPRQLLWPPFVDRLLHHLEEQGLPAKMLVLELSEHHLPKVDKALLLVLTRLKDIGVRLALDNFGAGFLALSQLGQLPVRRLKLDTRYLCGGGNEPARPLLMAQADLAEALQLEWMAEGVDDESCYRLLQERGCERFQGYLFSAPRPLDGFLSLLRTKGQIPPRTTTELS